jgi:hypothetical protein
MRGLRRRALGRLAADGAGAAERRHRCLLFQVAVATTSNFLY